MYEFTNALPRRSGFLPQGFERGMQESTCGLCDWQMPAPFSEHVLPFRYV